MKVLGRIFLSWQEIHRVLEGDGPQALEPPPHFYPEVGGLGWELMDEDQPLSRRGGLLRK